MSRFGAAFLTVLLLAASPVAAAEQPFHTIAREAAWGCRDKGDVFDLLFLGISTSFDAKLTGALADGRCVSFSPGESVVIVGSGEDGLVRIARPNSPAAYWTVSRNLK
jgi:hypothetical protein